MIDLEKEFAIDESKASDGISIPYKTAKIIVASASRKDFVNARDVLFARYPTKESLDSEEAQVKYEALIARYLVLGWEGFSLQFSDENCRKMLRVEGFRRWVMQNATNDSLFRVAQEEIAKN